MSLLSFSTHLWTRVCMCVYKFWVTYLYYSNSSLCTVPAALLKLWLTYCREEEGQELLLLQLLYSAGNASCSCSEDHYPPWGQAKDRTAAKSHDTSTATAAEMPLSLYSRPPEDISKHIFVWPIASLLIYSMPLVAWNPAHQTPVASAGLASWLVEAHQTGFI